MTNKPQFVGKRVSFTDAFSEVSHGVKKFKQNQYLEYGAHPIVDQGQELIVGYSDDETGLFNDVPVIVFGDHTRCVKYVEEPFFAGADGVKILKPRLSDNTRFWWHELKATPIENLGYSRHFKLLKAATFKTFDMASQTEITARLDNILDQIVQANQQIEQLDQLVKSRFVEMFGKAEDEHSDFPVKTLNDVCTSIVRGPFGSALKKEFFVPKRSGAYKVYEQKHAIQKQVDIGTYYISKDRFETLKRFECHPGDILMSCSGTMGKFYQLPQNCEPGVMNQALCKFTLSNSITADYFLGFMEQVIDELGAKGSGIKNVSSVKFIKAIRIPLPPVELQGRFAAFVSQVDKSRFISISRYRDILIKRMDADIHTYKVLIDRDSPN